MLDQPLKMACKEPLNSQLSASSSANSLGSTANNLEHEQNLAILSNELINKDSVAQGMAHVVASASIKASATLSSNVIKPQVVESTSSLPSYLLKQDFLLSQVQERTSCSSCYLIIEPSTDALSYVKPFTISSRLKITKLLCERDEQEAASEKAAQEKRSALAAASCTFKAATSSKKAKSLNNHNSLTNESKNLNAAATATVLASATATAQASFRVHAKAMDTAKANESNNNLQSLASSKRSNLLIGEQYEDLKAQVSSKLSTESFDLEQELQERSFNPEQSLGKAERGHGFELGIERDCESASATKAKYQGYKDGARSSSVKASPLLAEQVEGEASQGKKEDFVSYVKLMHQCTTPYKIIGTLWAVMPETGFPISSLEAQEIRNACTSSSLGSLNDKKQLKEVSEIDDKTILTSFLELLERHQIKVEGILVTKDATLEPLINTLEELKLDYIGELNASTAAFNKYQHKFVLEAYKDQQERLYLDKNSMQSRHHLEKLGDSGLTIHHKYRSKAFFYSDFKADIVLSYDYGKESRECLNYFKEIRQLVKRRCDAHDGKSAFIPDEFNGLINIEHNHYQVDEVELQHVIREQSFTALMAHHNSLKKIMQAYEPLHHAHRLLHRFINQVSFDVKKGKMHPADVERRSLIMENYKKNSQKTTCHLEKDVMAQLTTNNYVVKLVDKLKFKKETPLLLEDLSEQHLKNLSVGLPETNEEQGAKAEAELNAVANVETYADADAYAETYAEDDGYAASKSEGEKQSLASYKAQFNEAPEQALSQRQANKLTASYGCTATGFIKPHQYSNYETHKSQEQRAAVAPIDDCESLEAKAACGSLLGGSSNDQSHAHRAVNTLNEPNDLIKQPELSDNRSSMQPAKAKSKGKANSKASHANKHHLHGRPSLVDLSRRTKSHIYTPCCSDFSNFKKPVTLQALADGSICVSDPASIRKAKWSVFDLAACDAPNLQKLDQASLADENALNEVKSKLNDQRKARKLLSLDEYAS